MSALLTQVSGLEIHEVPDGYVVYQAEQDRVHYLNETAVVIFELCNGKLDADGIVTRIEDAYGLDASSRNDIRAGIESLTKEGLVLSSSK